jgi:hypothetical protein
MTIPDAVALLQLEGSTVTEDEMRANIAAGAPKNADGTINLLRYCGWLVMGTRRGGGLP